METFAVKDLSFTYPGKQTPALDRISFHVSMGEFIAICGQSGSGKSTLLRNLKPILVPHGTKTGEILFYGTPVEKLDQHQQAARIGYVLQNPDSQIVTDKVWHELAFGLENLGIDTKTIRLRVAEMASYFGIQTWFHKDVSHLSGGQKQLLNLASIMAMQPDVLILDEPTSQLDPIAAGEFLETVRKINQDLGVTVIITEHRLEEVMTMSDRTIVMDKGKIIADDSPANVGAILAAKNHPMFMAMPTPLQAYSLLWQEGIGKELPCPVNVREGRNWLTELFRGKELWKNSLPTESEKTPDTAPVVEMKEVWFRYNREDDDVIKDLSFKVYPGELFCMVGGNGTGKSTTLSLAGGIRKAYRGSVKIKGKNIEKYGKNELFKGIIGVLPQNPQSIFVEKTVRLDLMEMLEGRDGNGKNSWNVDAISKEEKIQQVAELVEINHLLDMHPYDLSGGEQQRAALAKVLLLEPEILFLDEPTKGIDNSFKFKLAGILRALLDRGVTIIMVSHDVEFCGRYGDRCAMFFDGKIITTNTPRIFFSGNSFYTTAANRMSRHIFENAVNVDDIVELVKDNLTGEPPDDGSGNDSSEIPDGSMGYDDSSDGGYKSGDNFSEASLIDDLNKKRIPEGAAEAAMFLLAAVTIWIGFDVLNNKQYFIVCVLIVVYALIPFAVDFERRKPKVREIVLLAVMIAAAVAARAAFIMAPGIKPIMAIVIISGVALGRKAGFMVGAMSMLISNFLFGQGPWTPWQMIAAALVGYLAGLLFHKRAGSVRKIPLLVYGVLSIFFLFGFIVDIWTVLIMADEITWEIITMIYGAAVYVNATHAAATAAFLLLLAKPIIGKLERVKKKYGMEIYGK